MEKVAKVQQAKSAITVANLAMLARTAGRKRMVKVEKAAKEAKQAFLLAKNVTIVAAITSKRIAGKLEEVRTSPPGAKVAKREKEKVAKAAKAARAAARKVPTPGNTQKKQLRKKKNFVVLTGFLEALSV